jgi:predicted nucleic acid-binding protein
MFYLDTSLLVAGLSNEAATPSAQRWLARRREASLCISAWTIPEFSSAMALKLRTGQVGFEQRAAMLAAFNALVEESLIVLAVRSPQFRTAARFVDREELGLRAGDALHLAIAFDVGATMVTFDRRVAGAGPALGVPTEVPA